MKPDTARRPVRCLLVLLLLVVPAFAFGASHPRLPREVLLRAVTTPAPRWKFVDPGRYREMRETFALLATAVATHEAPQTEVAGRPLAQHLADKLRSFLVTPVAD